jgi:biopolymer transport protein ExbB
MQPLPICLLTGSELSLLNLFRATGFVGPLMVIAGIVALVMALRRWLELRTSRLAPESVQRALEIKIHDLELDGAVRDAVSSRTFLGEVVGSGLYLRDAGLDEMLANVERGAAKESLRLGNRVANLARFGGAVLLVGLLGTTMALIFVMLRIGQLKTPTVNDFVTGIGEALVCMALALLIALFCFACFFVLDSRLTQRTLEVREIAEELIREAASKNRQG